MKDKIYIHYGTRWWNPQIFRQIRNREYFTKPEGGLWASPVDAKYGWRDWNEDEHYTECREENSFRFRCSENANILCIRNCSDLYKVARKRTLEDTEFQTWRESFETVYLDFWDLLNRGIDAVYVEISADPALYWKLYGWDCDSILIMNPNIVEVI